MTGLYIFRRSLWLLFEELTMGQGDQLGYKWKAFKQEGKGLD